MRDPQDRAFAVRCLARIDTEVTRSAPEFQEFLEPIHRQSFVDDERAARIASEELPQGFLVAAGRERAQDGNHGLIMPKSPGSGQDEQGRIYGM